MVNLNNVLIMNVKKKKEKKTSEVKKNFLFNP